MRRWLASFVLLVLAGSAGAADAQLLLVRAQASDPACDVPVFHGRLFSVPASQKLDEVATTLGLTLLTRVQELPYEDNAPSASSIPAGSYLATVRTEQTKPWMKQTPSRAWRLELANVPGRDPNTKRTAIQFHYGKDKSWSKGCVILTGAAPTGGLVCKAGDSADSPDAAVAAVRRYVESSLVSSADKIRVRIVEWPNAP